VHSLNDCALSMSPLGVVGNKALETNVMERLSMSDNVTPLHQRGLSLGLAYLPKTPAEQTSVTNRHPCAACAAPGDYIVGDSGPMRHLGEIAYYRAALKCRCGFMNFVYVVVNDLPAEVRGLNLPDADSALQAAAASGDLPDPQVEELLVRTSAAGFKEDWERATHLAKQCIERAPKHPAAWFNLGWLQVAASDYQSGLESYRRTLELSNDFPSAWLNMGNVYQHLEQYDDAVSCLERFLERYPNHAEAKRRHEECLAKVSTAAGG
jgi:tetratricopeptide (TPR) repeat protein